MHELERALEVIAVETGLRMDQSIIQFYKQVGSYYKSHNPASKDRLVLSIIVCCMDIIDYEASDEAIHKFFRCFPVEIALSDYIGTSRDSPLRNLLLTVIGKNK